jgi:hypothetical protein
MKVLVACEFSGEVGDAFAKKGHDVITCDYLDREKPGKHYKGNVYDIIGNGYDLMIAHPPCTYLCNSGVRWLYEEPGRRQKMVLGAVFFKWLLSQPIAKICVENPIPHKYALEVIGRKYDQVIQPYQFGHAEQKATCLWLKNLPPLKPTKEIIAGVKQSVHMCSPSPERSKIRSRTFPGIAAAMADAWG